jgi:soluble lytic murein transglycosylase-like protein
MAAAGKHRSTRTARITRAIAVAGTGVAVLALPVIGATSASAATPTVATATSLGYSDTLDGWIRASLQVMAQNGIPGSYDGIYRNIIRESSGNPAAINNWDSNAAAGTPSKGLLQVIDPTFEAYHVAGTAFNPYDPVANVFGAY